MGRHPDVLAGVEVNGGDAGIGRLGEGQPVWAGDPVHAVTAPVAELRPGLGGLQPHHHRARHRRHIKDVRVRVEPGAAPVGAAAPAGQLNRALERRWRVERPLVVLRRDALCLGLEFGREVDEGGVGKALLVERRRLGGEGLRGRCAFARHGAWRHGPLDDRPHRLAGVAVEDIHEALLRHLRDGLDGFAVHHDVHQVGRRRQVVIPQAVMHHLEVPDALAGGAVHAHEALREQVVAQAMAAVPIVGGRAHRQVNVAGRGIDAHGRPYVGVAAHPPGIALPRLDPHFPRLRNGVEAPALAAVPHVVATHVARRHLPRGGAVKDGRSHHRHIADDGRRADHRVMLGIDLASQALGEIHSAGLAKRRVWLAGAGIERPELGVVGGDEHPRRLAIRPIRHAAVVEAQVGGPPGEPRAGVEAPLLLARGAVQGHHEAERGVDVERAVDGER